MFEAALLRHNWIPGDVLNLADDGPSVEIGELHAVGSDDGEIAIPEEEQIAGVVKNCGNVGGDEIFVLAEANYGGRAIAGGDNFIRIVDGDNRQREYSGQLAYGFADGLFQWNMAAV